MDYKVPNVVREYAAALNDDELKYLFMRLDQAFKGDTAEALTIMQRHEGMDNWLATARSFEEFYNFLNIVCQQFEFETKRRGR